MTRYFDKIDMIATAIVIITMAALYTFLPSPIVGG
jgi:hypothetical protein